MNGSFICFGIFVMVCQPMHKGEAPGVINSYCAVYQRIIRTEEEGEQLGRIESRAVRERIAYNETLYRCECDGFDHAICRQEARTAESDSRSR